MLGTLAIIPKHYFDQHPGDFNSSPFGRAPVGSGPYKFVRWDTGEQIVLERDDNYWGGPGHYPRRLVYQLISESYVAAQLLKKGELDVVDGMSPLQWERELGAHPLGQAAAEGRLSLPGLFLPRLQPAPAHFLRHPRAPRHRPAHPARENSLPRFSSTSTAAPAPATTRPPRRTTIPRSRQPRRTARWRCNCSTRPAGRTTTATACSIKTASRSPSPCSSAAATRTRKRRRS